MSVNKIAKQKLAAEKQLAAVNQELLAVITPKVEETVSLLEEYQALASKDPAIKQLILRAAKTVLGDGFGVVDVRRQRNAKTHGQEISSTFDWQILAGLLQAEKATKEDKGLTKGELELLYFGESGVKFEHNKWNNKDQRSKHLVFNPNASNKTRKYWLAKKK
jgi:tRNA(His) 5'-end guanylyltransferase